MQRMIGNVVMLKVKAKTFMKLHPILLTSQRSTNKNPPAIC